MLSVRSELGQNLSRKAKQCYASCSASIVCQSCRLVGDGNVQDSCKVWCKYEDIAGYASPVNSPFPPCVLHVVRISALLCFVQIAGGERYVKAGFACAWQCKDSLTSRCICAK